MWREALLFKDHTKKVKETVGALQDWRQGLGWDADANGSLQQAHTTQGYLALLYPQEPRTTSFLDRIGVCVNTQKGSEGPKESKGKSLAFRPQI